MLKITATYISRNICRKSGTHCISTKDIDRVTVIKVCVNFLPYYIFITQFSAPNVTQNVATVVSENCSSQRGADEDSSLPEFIIVSNDK